jgi:hypothetical protein
VAAGNAALIFPIVMFFLIHLVYHVLKLLRMLPPPEEYGKGDVDAAVKTMGLLLLRLRDDKHKGIVPNGILLQFYKELRDATLINISEERFGAEGEGTAEREEGNGCTLCCGRGRGSGNAHNPLPTVQESPHDRCGGADPSVPASHLEIHLG